MSYKELFAKRERERIVISENQKEILTGNKNSITEAEKESAGMELNAKQIDYENKNWVLPSISEKLYIPFCIITLVLLPLNFISNMLQNSSTNNHSFFCNHRSIIVSCIIVLEIIAIIVAATIIVRKYKNDSLKPINENSISSNFQKNTCLFNYILFPLGFISPDNAGLILLFWLIYSITLLDFILQLIHDFIVRDKK